MKSARDILLDRHRAVEPKLDALRAKTVAELTPAAGSWPSRRTDGSWPVRVAWVFWRELIFPCRHIWAGLAAAWLVLLVLNFPGRGESKQQFEAKAVPPDPQILALLREQREMLAQLIQTSPSPAVPRKTPEPHSQVLQTITLV